MESASIINRGYRKPTLVLTRAVSFFNKLNVGDKANVEMDGEITKMFIFQDSDNNDMMAGRVFIHNVKLIDKKGKRA